MDKRIMEWIPYDLKKKKKRPGIRSRDEIVGRVGMDGKGSSRMYNMEKNWEGLCPNGQM